MTNRTWLTTDGYSIDGGHISCEESSYRLVKNGLNDPISASFEQHVNELNKIQYVKGKKQAKARVSKWLYTKTGTKWEANLFLKD